VTPLDLDGAVALVTGGASGIGAATAARLRDGGARVAVLDLQAHEGEGDLAVKCDVGDEDDVVWTYRDPLHDALEIKDRLAFFNERVEIDVDGEREPDIRTQWSRD